MRFTGAALLSFLFVATATFQQTASANAKFVTEYHSNELSYSLAVGWSNPIKWGEANQAKETLE